MEEQIPTQPPTAKDIQVLLGNIGAKHSASLPAIESVIRENRIRGDASAVTADELIDLIAQIRSM